MEADRCPHFVEDKVREVQLLKVRVSLSYSQVPTLQPLFQKPYQGGTLRLGWPQLEIWILTLFKGAVVKLDQQF